MTEPTKSKTSFTTLWILLVILLVIAASIFIFKEYGLQRGAEAASIQRKNVELNARIDALQKQIADVLAHRAEYQAEEQKQSEIKKAFLLTKLAAESLQYSREVPLAQQLIQTAASELEHVQDPAVVKVRGMLDADKQKLAAIKQVDLNAVTAQLNTLDQLVDTLATKSEAPTQPAHAVKTQSSAAEITSSDTSQWQKTMYQAFDSIKSSVKIRKKSDVELDLAYINTEFRRARFNLLIEQMRWATYYDDQAVLQRSVKETQDLLTKVFDANNPDVQKFAHTLDQLAALQLQHDLPNIQATVNALQALIVG